MSTRLFLRGLVCEARLGVHPHEKRAPRLVRVDIDLTLERTPLEDSIESAVCYDDRAADIRALARAEHVHLLETLGEKIANLCLKDSRVSAARVRIEKPGAVSGSVSAGVDIERKRS